MDEIERCFGHFLILSPSVAGVLVLYKLFQSDLTWEAHLLAAQEDKDKITVWAESARKYVGATYLYYFKTGCGDTVVSGIVAKSLDALLSSIAGNETMDALGNALLDQIAQVQTDP